MATPEPERGRSAARTRPRGLLLSGRLWPGGNAPVLPAASVVLDATGRIAALHPGPPPDQPPTDLPLLGGPGHWIGPGLVDAHVHLAFGAPAAGFVRSVVGLRDLGAPLPDALAWRSPTVAVAGPLLTAVDGYPTRSWGAAGFGYETDGPSAAEQAVHRLADAGVDLVKLALEPAGGPVPGLDWARRVVRAAHQRGLAVTAHALTVAMVERALAAGVDELCHTPTEPLPPRLVERLADSGIPVVSTLHTLAEGGAEAAVTENARRLVAAGVRLRYGTDLGNVATRPGAEPRELVRLAAAGLGPLGAVRAATDQAADSAGLSGRGLGLLRTGEPASLVLLTADPVADPERWREPVLTVVAGERYPGPAADGLTGSVPDRRAD